MLNSQSSFSMRHATPIAMIVLTLLSGLAAYIFQQQNKQIIAADQWVDHTYEVKGHLQELTSRLRDAVGGERTYMFTGDESYLYSYSEAIRASDAQAMSDSLNQHHSISEEIDIIRRETVDNTIQQQNINDVERLSNELLGYLADTIKLRKAGTASPDILKTDAPRTKDYMDHLRVLLNTMLAEENRLLAQRTITDINTLHSNNAMTIASVGAFWALLMVSVLVYQRTRNAAQAELIKYARQLERNEEELKLQQEELKASNEEIESSNEELEEQNAQIRMQSDELNKSKRLIEEKASEIEQASKYKTEFLANMSHELRTPLNSLLILARSLASNEDGNLTTEQIEEARIIHNDGLELLNLINEILDLSKVEAGKLDIIAENVSLKDITDRISQQFMPLARDRKLAFPVIIEADISDTIHTDAHRVERILKNLLSNAFKFTESGAVTLRIHRPDPARMQRTRGMPAVGFSVIDTGIGIDPARFAHIFEAFQQEDGATDRHYGGTGLGLTIARKFGQLLGGEILVESEKGVGSSFTLILPLRSALAAERPDDSQPQTIELKEMPRMLAEEFVPDDRTTIEKNDKILLIVEDDRNFASVLMKIARKKGYKCLVTSSGKNAVILATEQPVTAIILDLKLADIPGLQVLDMLKQDLRARHIPVHIITGTAPADNVVPMHKGAVGYMVKPVEQAAIEDALTRIETMLHTDMQRILVVEDGRDQQLAIRHLLEKKDLQLVVTDNGITGLEKLNEGAFDCVILDLKLPDIGGIEWLARAASEQKTLPPVVIYTAKQLTAEESRLLGQYTSNIIIKGERSAERLLDAVTLFLHSLESTLPREQREILRMQVDPNGMLSGRNLLLVDDDLRNTFALSKILKKQGLNVTIADNGKMALDLLREKPIDLVIMDIMMPVMDGYQAMREMRKDPSLAAVPVIALTARAMPEEQSKCLAAGANDYLTKPVDVERLLTLLRVLLFRQEKAG